MILSSDTNDMRISSRRNYSEVNKISGNDIKIEFSEAFTPDKTLPTSVVRRVPFFFWSLACLLIGIAVLFQVNMFLPEKKRMFKAFNDGAWWEYLVVLVLILVAISIFFASKLEKIEIDNLKQNNLITIEKLQVITMKRSRECYPLSAVKAIYPIKTGKQNSSHSSVIYRVGMRIGDSAVNALPSVFAFVVLGDVMKLRKIVFGEEVEVEQVQRETRDAINYLG